MQAAVFAGVMGAALLSAIWLIRERGRTAAENVLLRARLADLNASLQRSEALLNLRDQRIVVWAGEKSKPEVVGALPAETGAPEDRSSFLAFGRWLMPRSAAALEQAVTALRERATGFDLVVETHKSAPLEVHGRKTAAHILVRFVSLSETQRLAARLKLENQRLSADHETILDLLDALDHAVLGPQRRRPAEMGEPGFRESCRSRERRGRRARRQGIPRQPGARSGGEAPGRPSAVFEQTMSTVVEGDRRMFAITDVAGGGGSAGIAVDMTRSRGHPRRI